MTLNKEPKMNPKAEFTRRLNRELKKEGSLPILSPTAVKIQSEALKKDPHFSVLAGLIRKDPTLTSQILKIANAPMYRGVGQAETLKDALTRLGQVEMVHVIMAAIHRNNFRSTHPLISRYQGQLWHHSVACATGSLWMARHLGLKKIIPKAFIAGLLHDMGKLHILTALEQILGAGDYPLPLDWMEAALADLHPDLGHALLSRWGLPVQYSIIARDHHSPDLSDPLLVIIKLSNALSRALETDEDPRTLAKIHHSKPARHLGMDESWIEPFKAAIKDV